MKLNGLTRLVKSAPFVRSARLIAKKALLMGSILSLLTGCVTETTGGSKREVDPAKQLKAHIDLGMGYISNGEFGRAKENLTTALELDPDSAQAHNAFGLLFQLEGENGLAEMHFKKTVSLEPGFAAGRNNYGAFLYARGRYAEAIEQLVAASENQLYQRRSQVFENLGVCYVHLGDIEAAEAAFIRSLQLNSGQRRALIELGEIRFDQQNYVAARDFYIRHTRIAQQSARSLWLCIRVSRVFDAEDQEASCSLALRNVFPGTPEFEDYQSSLAN